ncbi:hypothetical protein EJ08DRAFT_717688 [Tothia fuscella]|uniref:Nineteen complex-related protein 2-domain-containing protein n=1 Tax=Tothia fuscella TaxID=1048955 RepID=A0A9P4P2G3_9PEZI|nr:hypothetical protein EJ08DRAFT_717688 [Tothia fuscella]
MKKSFSARRVARRVGQEDGDDSNQSSGTFGAETSPDSLVKRPAITSKTKKKSALRLSFGPGEGGPDTPAGDDGSSSVFTPKKSNLSRLAMQKHAERKSLRPSLSSESMSMRPGVSEDRPSYSKDYLAELKQSTPSTPKDLGPLRASDDEDLQVVDITSKFGPLAKLGSDNSAIPTEAEIKEKKERRARMAKAPDFLSLEGNESDEEGNRELLIRPKEKYAETRLVREDEDLAEGFEDYVEDGKISLGRKAEREAARKKRIEMEEMILEAEGVGSDQSSDDSEVERNEAYEAAQTRAGTYGQTGISAGNAQRPKTPPRIAPVPELSAVLLKMRSSLLSMEQSKAAKARKLEELRAERKDIAEREVYIQAQLKETGDRYEKFRIEADALGSNGTEGHTEGRSLFTNRGLDSMGTNTPLSNASDG